MKNYFGKMLSIITSFSSFKMHKFETKQQVWKVTMK